MLKLFAVFVVFAGFDKGPDVFTHKQVQCHDSRMSAKWRQHGDYYQSSGKCTGRIWVIDNHK